MSKKAFTVVRFFSLFVLVFLFTTSSYAQFTSNIQGIVQDPSGAGVPKAKVQLVNVATQVTQTTTADDAGNYRFVSLAPGNYKITVEAPGFQKSEATVTLLTEQNLNLPIPLKVGQVTEAVSVTAEAPVVDTADDRNQLTLQNSTVAQLPIPGRNLVTLTTYAPGVTGLGTVGGGQPGAPGTPGSGVDNYSTETQVDASANGQGQMSNMYVIDGLDITSGIRQGVLNLTPNPESIQETSVQVNTYSAEYSRATGVEEVMTTRSGSDQFHGEAADWFYFQKMFAATHFSPSYLPFHGNNMSFSIGGPIIPHHQLYGFFAVEPLRSALATSGAVQFPDPQFVTWATTNYPGNVGPGLLQKYAPTNLSGVSVLHTASVIPGCGTPATNNLPCSTNLIDSGDFSATAIRNGTQYFARVDKYFAKDRIYGSFYRTLLNYGAASDIPAFSALNNNWERAFQVNWTHTFNPNTLNEAIFGANRVEGVLGSGATGSPSPYTVPFVNVTGMSQTYGVGFAQGDFIQHNYHWRDVLTHVRGTHTLKFGYEGWYGDDVEPFQGPWSQPTFSFDNLLTLAQDSPHTESHVYYNPITGQEQLWSWDAASRTWGLFAEDTWKARRNLTLTLGLRWDDSGNPWTKAPATTVFGNFYLGPGQTFDEQVATGFVKATHNALNHSVTDLLSPRVGFAWDVTGTGSTVVRGGFGVFNDWLTQANVQEEFRGSPPGEIAPTFTKGTATPPIFALGTSDKPPFGFTFPSLAGSPICPTLGANGCLNSQGGIVGGNFGIGAINPNLLSPKADIWSLAIERKLATNYSLGVGYSGSHGYHMVGAGDQAGIVSYGQDINAFADDLIINETLSPTRLNHSFGAIAYADNNRHSNYESVYFEFKGRFARNGSFDASYTRSESKDDAAVYPAEANPDTYYGPSPWDAPNRFSLTLNYQLPGLTGSGEAVKRVTSGWGVSGTSLFQSGYPAMVATSAAFVALCADGTNSSQPGSGCPGPSPAKNIVGDLGGDYNADGESTGVAASINLTGVDYPDVTSYHQGTSKQAFLTGVFSPGQFTPPALGTEGNEKPFPFRTPNFEETDASFYKDTHITERVTFQIRFEFYNIFNRVNLTAFEPDLSSGAFGKATAQQLPRNWQIGGRLTF
jgi:hypothetical protein